MRDRPNSSSLHVCDQVCDLDSVMEFGVYGVSVEGYALCSIVREANDAVVYVDWISCSASEDNFFVSLVNR